VQDIPGPDGRDDITWELFQEYMSTPGLDHRLMMAAVSGNEVVGLAHMARNTVDPSLAWHWLTGVRRDWRRRGLAAALKDAQLVSARALGVRQVRTANELRNAPIRRLNARMGYRPEPDHIQMRGPLQDLPAEGSW
jgi:predicted GNAT superfamily acetyltransferase